MNTVLGRLARRERYEFEEGWRFVAVPLFLSLIWKCTIFMSETNLLSKMRANWKSGLTVALVSIPLSLSLAIASGATPIQGIITAIWAGLIYSFFAGSHYNIVGPTGALSGILAVFAFTYGFQTLPFLAIAAGIAMYAAYLFKLERYLVFIPASALHGFTLGVAFIIGLNQLNFILGLSGLPKHDRFIENIFESFSHIGESSPSAFAIFVIFLAALFFFARKFPKIPGAVALAPVGIILGYLASKDLIGLDIRTLEDAYGALSLTLFQVPRFVFAADMLWPVLAVALVAIMETMISAKIADGMTKTKHDKRSEMKALALSNIASGLMGGIPATAALARTSLNVKSGADDRMSATLNSVFVAVISVFLLGYFKYIPLAVIAAILVFVAVRMVEIVHYKRVLDKDRRSFALILLVAFITVYDDPIVGILFGTAVTLVMFVETLSRGQFEMVFNHPEKKMTGKIFGDQNGIVVHRDDAEACHTIVYSLKGQLAYLNAQAHLERFEKRLHDYENVVLRFRELYLIDLDGADAFDEIVEIIERRGKKVYVSGVNPFIEKMLRKSNAYPRLEKEHRVFAKTTEALEALGYGKPGYEERAFSL